MTIEEVQELLGKIGYINQLHPEQFKKTKFKAIKRLKELTNNGTAIQEGKEN